jgi:hypothetical protein
MNTKLTRIDIGESSFVSKAEKKRKDKVGS